MIWSIVSLFLCLPTGVVALVKASNANSKRAQGDIEGGRAEASQAKTWLTISFILGAIGILFALAGGFSSGSSGY